MIGARTRIGQQWRKMSYLVALRCGLLTPFGPDTYPALRNHRLVWLNLRVAISCGKLERAISNDLTTFGLATQCSAY